METQKERTCHRFFVLQQLYHVLPELARKKFRSGFLTPQEKYDKQNTRFIGLKLNRKSDKDILDALEGKALQTEIKRLLRKALESEKEEKE